MICQQATNRFRPSKLTKHHPRYPLTEVDNKSGEQSWPQLMCCASICCHMCGCIFQEDRKTELLPGVQERSGILIRVRIEHVKDIIDVNLRTKELGCN